MSLDFLDGFADATGFSREEANEQWAAFSRQLSDAEIKQIEDGGYDAGQDEAEKFRELYPAKEDD